MSKFIGSWIKASLAEYLFLQLYGALKEPKCCLSLSFQTNKQVIERKGHNVLFLLRILVLLHAHAPRHRSKLFTPKGTDPECPMAASPEAQDKLFLNKISY